MAAALPLGPTPATSLRPLWLTPGDELRQALVAPLAREAVRAAWVVGGIGCLSLARLRLAGSLSPDGAPLPISVADARGRVGGGHLVAGSLVRTSAELGISSWPERQPESR